MSAGFLACFIYKKAPAGIYTGRGFFVFSNCFQGSCKTGGVVRFSLREV
ncbi:hypothetical protein APS_2544 [Acetobacter pasteurianus subsp. pasteurianus LMG 1262 = NBRC 106471]|nr:hypothetical protein APS_2544 [Acetobacter pasteurianus subsp. pasteurianus LMG 1262 = NBRC 106471]